MQQQAESVVGAVAESEAHSLDPLDEQVHRLRRPVANPAGAEVGEQLRLPRRDGAAEPLELGNAGGGTGLIERVQPTPGPVQIGAA